MTCPILHIECFRGTVRVSRKNLPVRPYFFRIVTDDGDEIASSKAFTDSGKRTKTARLLASAKLEMT
jgi:hypothetical protein